MTLRVSLVTEGDPASISGGYLYQRRVAERAPAHGADIRFVSMRSPRYPRGMLHGGAVLRDAADADVIVVDSLASNSLGPWLAGGGPRPLVGSVHQILGGLVGGRLNRAVRRRADRWAWRTCRHLVVPSAFLAQRLRRDGIVTPQMFVVPPGREIPERGSRPASAGDLRRGRRVAVLCVANWIAEKGVAELLDAAARLPAEAITVHLVGDEELGGAAYRERVLARLHDPALAGRVVRHGITPPAVVAELFDAADVFVLASEEPYGMVYAEAMVAGLPVVGWRAGNLPNLVDDGVEGRLLGHGDVAGLAAALGELADDDELRRRLGAAARRRAATLPTWDDTTAAFVAVCRAAAGSG